MKVALVVATAVVMVGGCESTRNDRVATPGEAPPAPSPLPRPQAPPPPPPEGPPAAPVHTFPDGALDLPCLVRAEIEPTIAGGDVSLRFVLRNTNPEPQTVTLRGSCPAGLVTLRGLPDSFDPMHTCTRGACIEATESRTLTIPGGHATVVIGETKLRGKGDSCNPALPIGSTFLEAEVATDLREVCTGGAIHLVRSPDGRLRRAGLLDPPVEPAVEPRPTTKPAPPARPPATPPPPSPRKTCPTCAFACLDGVPSSRVDANGCAICACE